MSSTTRRLAFAAASALLLAGQISCGEAPGALADAGSSADGGGVNRCPPEIASGGLGVAVLGPSCAPGGATCAYGALSAACVEPENVWAYCSDAVGCVAEGTAPGTVCCYHPTCDPTQGAPDSGIAGPRCWCDRSQHVVCH